MSNSFPWLVLAAGIAVVALLWAPIGPAQLGGPVSLVVTHGSSMEPGIYQGDLVVVRKTSQVASGDIVLYRSQTTGQQTLHRVIAIAGDTAITRGDNNSWIDPDRPAVDEIRGVHWFQVTGTAVADLIIGGQGARQAQGRTGDDCIVGGTGIETINAQQGFDVCIGPATATFRDCEVIVHR